ncbi:GNAT family N-acetyltransferase [soil metagenome]
MLKIRHAVSADVHIISALAITTCYEAYFELDPSPDLAEYCLKAFDLQTITTELENTNSTFLLAELNTKAIGYAKLREGKEVECLRGANAIEIQRIYLLEKAKGKNFGRALIEKCIAIAKEKGYEILWLGVWDKNIAAQRFYERLGFKNIGTTGFSDGKTSFINFVMKKNL